MDDIEAIRAGKLKQLPGFNLEDEDFAGVDLRRIHLAGAVLVGTNFSGSNHRRRVSGGSQYARGSVGGR